MAHFETSRKSAGFGMTNSVTLGSQLGVSVTAGDVLPPNPSPAVTSFPNPVHGLPSVPETSGSLAAFADEPRFSIFKKLMTLRVSAASSIQVSLLSFIVAYRVWGFSSWWQYQGVPQQEQRELTDSFRSHLRHRNFLNRNNTKNRTEMSGALTGNESDLLIWRGLHGPQKRKLTLRSFSRLIRGQCGDGLQTIMNRQRTL